MTWYFEPARAPDGGLPLRLFKALQLVHTRNLKADFDDFVAFDIETSDFDFESSQIVDIAAVRVRDNVVVDRFHSLVSCTRPISAQATDVHGYTDRDLIGAPPMSEVWQRFREFVGTDLVVAHNGQEFDVPVLRRACDGLDGFDELVFYDTLPTCPRRGRWQRQAQVSRREVQHRAWKRSTTRSTMRACSPRSCPSSTS